MREVQAGAVRAHGGELRVVQIAGQRDAHRVGADADFNCIDRTPEAFAVGGDEVLRGERQQFGIGRVQQPGA